jgi:hypothetical protein
MINSALGKLRGLFLCVGLALLLASCGSGESPEQQLRTTLDGMREAAVSGQIGEFMDHVANDFSGQGGGFDRSGLNSLLRVQLLRHSRVTATIVSSEYQMFDDRATIELSVLLTGGPKTWLPDSGRVYKITTGWRDDGGDWELISARWK